MAVAWEACGCHKYLSIFALETLVIIKEDGMALQRIANEADLAVDCKVGRASEG